MNIYEEPEGEQEFTLGSYAFKGIGPCSLCHGESREKKQGCIVCRGVGLTIRWIPLEELKYKLPSFPF